MNTHRAHSGFTLIELMITVAIVAILGAAAYPSYLDYVARTKRADAQAGLLDAAQWMERQYTLSSSYSRKADGSTLDSAALPPLRTNTAASYTLSFSGTPSATDFTLQMVPGGAMASDKCGTYSLTHTGAKSVSGSAGTAACWDR